MMKLAVKLSMVLLLVGVVASLIGPRSPRSGAPTPAAPPPAASPDGSGLPPPPTGTTVSVGDFGVLELRGARYIWLAVKDEDWNPLIDAENFGAKGGEGATEPLKDLVKAGRAFGCPRGTRVRVEKTSFASRFVRVLEGEEKGSTGWVQYEFVRKISESEAAASNAPESAAAPAPSAKPRPTLEQKPVDAAARARTLLRSAENSAGMGHDKAAAELYRQVVREYPGSAEARAAGERLGGKP
jgi:hypothetical protein